MYRQSEKNLLNSNISSTCAHNVVNLANKRLRSVGEFGSPQQISTGFASGLCYCSDVAQPKPTKLCTKFDHLLCWDTIYTFSGVLPRNGVLPGAKFTLRPCLALSYISSVTARHSSIGRQPNCGVEQRAPPIFGRAAITLVIGPHL